ncbi:proline-rich protein 36-like [Panicum virgatum]|uniref:proline-rich protein 36-like n=1 Tax=Panicum virgatum TaxID=38727 RepID=UPI0019D5E589|nr:proline-rich protein 36-like [Panicum virgatum]
MPTFACLAAHVTLTCPQQHRTSSRPSQPSVFFLATLVITRVTTVWISHPTESSLLALWCSMRHPFHSLALEHHPLILIFCLSLRSRSSRSGPPLQVLLTTPRLAPRPLRSLRPTSHPLRPLTPQARSSWCRSYTPRHVRPRLPRHRPRHAWPRLLRHPAPAPRAASSPAPCAAPSPAPAPRAAPPLLVYSRRPRPAAAPAPPAPSPPPAATVPARLPPGAVPIAPVVNQHGMATRGKSGFRQPAAYTATVLSPVPKTYRSALADPNWRAAMEEEYGALLSNNTWDLVPRPLGANVVTELAGASARRQECFLAWHPQRDSLLLPAHRFC